MGRKTVYWEDCLLRFKTKHGDKYDYSESRKTFVNTLSKIYIKCSQHGYFFQQVQKHFEGEQCPKCAILKRSGTNKSKEYYINKFREMYGDEYCYSLYLEHTNYKQNIDIICKKHGVFTVKVCDHAMGRKCPKCVKENWVNPTPPSNRDDVVDRFNKVHNFRYDYSLYEKHIDMHQNIPIICKKHGLFFKHCQRHLRGVGCPRCGKESQGERAVRKYLELRGIRYEIQKSFHDLFGGSGYRRVKFDFYLPTLNTCIEFDGSVHFKVIFSVKSLKAVQTNDLIKTEYCKKNGINLIRITKIQDIPLMLNGLIGLPTETAKISYKREIGWFAKEHPIMCN